jgi:hypothetical protein
VLVLLVVVCAGFETGASVGMLHDYFTLDMKVPLDELPLMFALIGVPNFIAVFLFVKVWRSSTAWTLLGHRKLVWQILLSVSYGMGLCGSLMMIL